MPNRIIKQSHCTSKTIAALGTDWAAIVLFDRLIVTVDDYGRFEADPQLVRASCYPRLLDRVSTKQVSDWLDSLARVGLIRFYTAGDESTRYGALCKWDNHQRIRNQQSKYPAPPTSNLLSIDRDSRRIAADCGLNPNPNPNPNLESELESERESPAPSADGLALARILQSGLSKRFPRLAASKLAGAKLDAHLTRWAHEFDRNLRVDGKTKAELAACVEWATADDFWSRNAQSPGSFRTMKRGTNAKVWIDFEAKAGPVPESRYRDLSGYAADLERQAH